MTVQRQYESATIFNNRIVDMRHIWTPSDTYKGQKTQKPNYFGMFIVPKTQAHWSAEPVFAGCMAAFNKLLQGQLQHFASNPNAVIWPIGDGDLPNAEGKSSEFAKGHWIFSASSGNAPNVELAQPNGTLVKLQNKVGVKSGDHTMVGVTAAVKQNQPNGVKFYLNAVVFTAPGEEIVFANSVSGAELMAQAKAQGLNVAGFSGSPGGFGQPQGGGFAQPGQFQQPGGFGAPQAAPQGFGQPPQGGGFGQGFTQPGAGAAQTGGFAQPATGQNGPGFGGGAAYPSNAAPQGFGQPQGMPGFGQPQPGPAFGQMTQGGFAPPFPGQGR